MSYKNPERMGFREDMSEAERLVAIQYNDMQRALETAEHEAMLRERVSLQPWWKRLSIWWSERKKRPTGG